MAASLTVDENLADSEAVLFSWRRFTLDHNVLPSDSACDSDYTSVASVTSVNQPLNGWSSPLDQKHSLHYWGLAKRGNTVAEILLRTQMFPGLAT